MRIVVWVVAVAMVGGTVVRRHGRCGQLIPPGCTVCGHGLSSRTICLHASAVRGWLWGRGCGLAATPPQSLPSAGARGRCLLAPRRLPWEQRRAASPPLLPGFSRPRPRLGDAYAPPRSHDPILTPPTHPPSPFHSALPTRHPHMSPTPQAEVLVAVSAPLPLWSAIAAEYWRAGKPGALRASGVFACARGRGEL